MIYLIVLLNIASSTTLIEKHVSTLKEHDQMIIIQRMLQNYDASHRAQIGRQLTVLTNFYVQLLSEINEQSMDFEMSVFFR